LGDALNSSSPRPETPCLEKNGFFTKKEPINKVNNKDDLCHAVQHFLPNRAQSQPGDPFVDVAKIKRILFRPKDGRDISGMFWLRSEPVTSVAADHNNLDWCVVLRACRPEDQNEGSSVDTLAKAQNLYLIHQPPDFVYPTIFG
jgi:hypothetical protein